MSFVRAKEIPPHSGNWYDYECITVHNGPKVNQKVVRYLGRSGKHSYLPRDEGTNSKVLTSPDKTTPLADTTRIPKMKTPARQIASAMGMYYGGMSLDGSQQQFKQDHGLDMSESSYWNWVKRFTKEAVKQSRDFHPDVGNVWVADETYMKLGDQPVYFWDIIDIKTKFLLASRVSFSRGSEDARALMRLAEEKAGKKPRIVITDKLAAYIHGVKDTYGKEAIHIQGGPFKPVDSFESTAEIERFHKTLEQRTKVFEKYKDLLSIRLLTAGWLINYNYFKQNEGCGNIPPAQAANKVVPFKDWNDIVRDAKLPDIDYKVKLQKRETVKKGNPVMDVTLTPVEKESDKSA